MRRTWNFPARAVPPTPAADGRPATAASQHVDRGLRALSAGSGEAALAAFDAALALTPADAEVISLRALALAMVGRWEEAETEAGRAIQLEPHERAFQGNLAQILERRGPAETSQAAARRDWPAVTLGPSNLLADRVQEVLRRLDGPYGGRDLCLLGISSIDVGRQIGRRHRYPDPSKLDAVIGIVIR